MKDTTEQGKGLARKVLSPNQVCDRSKLDKIELEHLNDIVEHARSLTAYSGEYQAEDRITRKA